MMQSCGGAVKSCGGQVARPKARPRPTTESSAESYLVKSVFDVAVKNDNKVFDAQVSSHKSLDA